MLFIYIRRYRLKLALQLNQYEVKMKINIKFLELEHKIQYLLIKCFLKFFLKAFTVF